MTNADESYHYQIIGRAIKEIDVAEGNLSLDELAARIGLSPAHFQRVFSKFVGVSPKRYQQFLTLSHAKTLLRERFSTLATTHSVGLSGQGRLHDLFLRWEAMSPGEYAKRGAGLTIFWGWFDSPFGPSLVMGTDKGICGIGFCEETGPELAFQDLISRWPNANFVEDPMFLEPWVLAAYDMKPGETGKTPLHLIGSPLQIKVWEALLTIPSGHVTTYGDIAEAIGKPRAVRAVGTAVGRNPVSWMIPCHRALRKSGALGGYHWGLPVKRALLAWETAEMESTAPAGGLSEMASKAASG